MSETTKYVWFRGPLQPEGRKTHIWEVASMQGSDTLGSVKWFGRWRRYAFFPEPGCIFDEICLRDIADFCEQETRTHRENLKVTRASAAT